MWNKTKATQLLGIKYPIIQGPFGGRFSSAKLVSTVSNLGGMGSFGLNSFGPEEILSVNSDIKNLTAKPYVLNLWVPLKEDPVSNYDREDFESLKNTFRPFFEELNLPLPDMPPKIKISFEDQVEAVLKAKPPVMSFIFGIPPKEVIEGAKNRGIITIGTATTTDEALAIEEAEMDLVVASGSEAGGHRASFLKSAEESLIGTSSLIQQVVDKIKIPVIAAGGISDGAAIISTLTLGASAVQIGTAFLATEESNASDNHKAKLLSREPIKTTLTKVYTGRLARVISNDLTVEFLNYKENNFAPYPLQSSFLGPLIAEASIQGKKNWLAYYSGEPSAILKHNSTVKLFKALVAEAEKIYTVTASK